MGERRRNTGRRALAGLLALGAWLASPAQATPRTGAYAALSLSEPRLSLVVDVYDGVLDLTYVPRHTVSGGQIFYALSGSLRMPLPVLPEQAQWPAITALIGIQRQQGGYGNATNAVEYGFKLGKTFLPWLSAHLLLTNASVLVASSPNAIIGRDLWFLPRVELGAAFQPTPALTLHAGFRFWTSAADLNQPTTFLQGVQGYPSFLVGVNYQLAEVLGLPEPGPVRPLVQPSPTAPNPEPSPSPAAGTRP